MSHLYDELAHGVPRYLRFKSDRRRLPKQDGFDTGEVLVVHHISIDDKVIGARTDPEEQLREFLWQLVTRH